MADLLELAARCERATADEQRELLIEAWQALRGFPNEGWAMGFYAFRRMLDAEAYESVAMMLVPEGAEWLRKSPEAMTVYFHPKNDKVWATHHSSGGATPALALCAAALRARAAS